MSTFCNECGFDNPPQMKFCGNCGSRLDSAAKPSQRLVSSERAPAQQLGELVGSDLMARFQQAGLQAANQRRNVTVLFADLSDYTHLSTKIDPEDLYEIIQQFIKMLANMVYKYDGIVDKFIGDGLMALFGAPIAHENNAERALHAALDMQVGLTELNQSITDQFGVELEMHIGLNSGVVIVGSVGSDMLMDYTAIGETVNMAQRLDAVAGAGNILVSESVFGQTQRLFNFDGRPDLNLKGLSEPVTGYQLIAEKSTPGSVRGLEGLRAPMIGRQSELQKLEDAVDTLGRQKTGKFVLIRGEAGIGKSRLIAELKTKIEAAPVKILEGQSLTYRRSVAYWIFQEILRDYLGVFPGMSDSQVRQRLNDKVRALLGTGNAVLTSYLEYMLALELSDPTAAERLALLDPNQIRQQIFISVHLLLATEAEIQPLVIILDDLHWADEVSLELLRFLLDDVKQFPLLICGITRPFDAGLLLTIEDQAQQRLDEDYIDIRLMSLAADQSELLLHNLLTISDFPNSLRDQIIHRANGVPFYLEEILRMLIDDEVLFYENTQWIINPQADLSNLGVPENLQALILTRFDHLAPEFQEILQVAAVIGREFDLSVVAAILNRPSIELHDLMTQLVERAFVFQNPGESNASFSFRHVLTSDAIYSTLLRRERAELHGLIGAAIEDLYPERLNENLYLLARHYSWSKNFEKALHYQILAGQRAARDYLNEQAQTYFEQAVENLDQIDHLATQAIQAYTGLGDVLVFVGEYDSAREYFKKAETLVDLNNPDSVQTYILLRRKIGTTFERLGNFDRALAYLGTAQQFAQENSLPLKIERAKNLNDIGWIHFRRGNLELAESSLQNALELVRSTSQYAVIASIYNRLGGIYYQKDDLEKAHNYVRRSLVLREEIGDIGEVARSYNNLGLLGWKRGDWDDALENFSRSIKLNQTLGDVEATIFLHMNTGLLLTDKGDLAAAQQHLDESLARAKQIGHSALEAQTYLHYSRYWLASQEWEKSLFYSNRALEIFDEIGSQESLVDLNASIGEAWLGLGDLEKAGEACDQAIACCGDDPETIPPLEQGRISRLRGEIERQQGNLDQSLEAFKVSVSLFIGLNNQLELGRTYVALAQLEKDRDNASGARIHAREANMIFSHLGASLDLDTLSNLKI
jgi:predicted ATPase/class 3 adenylate cyclase